MKHKEDLLIVLCTCPEPEEADKLANLLVKEKLAACINIIPIASVYRWDGKIAKDGEYQLLIKTRAGLFEDLKSVIEKEHSYAIPELMALPVCQVSAEYLSWAMESTGDDSKNN